MRCAKRSLYKIAARHALFCCDASWTQPNDEEYLGLSPVGCFDHAACASVPTLLMVCQVLSGSSGGSLGYGFATKTADDDSPSDSEDDVVGLQPAAAAVA